MLAILVPVLGRPHQIGPLLESLARTTTSEYRVVFICSPSDETKEVCLASDGDTIVVPWEPAHADFQKKINLAFDSTEEPWLFQAATDLVFHPGWDHHALAVATRLGVGVVGTNDMGNPMVKRGKHSTHTLFSRDYIETFGGTYDDTGRVFSEAYNHQFVDTEFIQTAIHRKQFSFSQRSLVEHLHPHWKKGEMDSTYEKATGSWREDQALYVERIRAVTPPRYAGRRRNR